MLRLLRVRALIGEWDEPGRPQQGAIPWDRERWIRALQEHAAALDRLPDHLDRDGVRAACEDASAGPAEAAAAFVCVMAWGYGDNASDTRRKVEPSPSKPQGRPASAISMRGSSSRKSNWLAILPVAVL